MLMALVGRPLTKALFIFFFFFFLQPLTATYNPAQHQILFENGLSVSEVHEPSTSSESGPRERDQF